ncbi:hypothetical protein [Persicirhabdus sediminis]|uniref:Thioredoxin domain-containing protein n=1 Tax=Persicirhabdus sediminis TaxID=454144 RepID=A0A8J7MH81_9BACT|nr:hypothetical protein [Persicirhabdus sediminis]MBK1791824.1 hypothetical protein [Persicirhabdus sediminis]
MKRIKLSLSIALLTAFALPSNAQEIPRYDSRQETLERLFSARSEAALQQAIDEARKAGFSEQSLTEARFLFLIDKQDHRALAAMADELEAKKDTFSLNDSEIFSLEDDWLAIISFTKSLAELEQGNIEGFKKNITEAFWLSPQQASAYTPIIEKTKTAEAMKQLTLDLEQRVLQLNVDDGIALKETLKGKSAALIHFWSPWSEASEASMADFILTARELNKHNIAILHTLIDITIEGRGEGQYIYKLHNKDLPYFWLQDTKNNSLSGTLRVRDTPTVCLLTPEGKVLFNGAPSDPNFWNTVKLIAPELQRPNAQPHQGHNH